MDRHTRLQALTTVHHSPLSDTSIARREDTYQARSITEISHRSGEVTALGICPSEVLSHGELRGCSIVRNHQNMGVELQHRRRAHRRNRPLDSPCQRVSLVGSDGQQHNIASVHDGTEPLGDAVTRDLLPLLKEAGIVSLCALRKGLDASARRQRTGGLIETNMSICPNAKDLNIDAISLLDGCLVCGAGSIEVIGH